MGWLLTIVLHRKFRFRRKKKLVVIKKYKYAVKPIKIYLSPRYRPNHIFLFNIVVLVITYKKSCFFNVVSLDGKVSKPGVWTAGRCGFNNFKKRAECNIIAVASKSIDYFPTPIYDYTHYLRFKGRSKKRNRWIIAGLRETQIMPRCVEVNIATMFNGTRLSKIPRKK